MFNLNSFEMNKDDLMKNVESMVKETRKDDSLVSLPIEAGTRFTFVSNPDALITKRTGQSRDAQGNRGAEFSYYVFNTVEGYAVPFKHIAYTGNGLNLCPTGYTDAIKKMVEKCLAAPLTVKVAKVKEFETSYGTNRLYVFAEQ